MEIRAAGADETEILRGLVEPPLRLAPVLRVPDLEAAESRRHELLDQPPRQEARMRQHGHAAGVADRAHGLRGAERRSRHERGARRV